MGWLFVLGKAPAMRTYGRFCLRFRLKTADLFEPGKTYFCSQLSNIAKLCPAAEAEGAFMRLLLRQKERFVVMTAYSFDQAPGQSA